MKKNALYARDLERLRRRVQKRFDRLVKGVLTPWKRWRRPWGSAQPESEEVACNPRFALATFKKDGDDIVDRAMDKSADVLANECIKRAGRGFSLYSPIHVLAADDPGGPAINEDGYVEYNPPCIGYCLFLEVGRPKGGR